MPADSGKAASVVLLGGIILQVQVLYLWRTANKRQRVACGELVSRATCMLVALLLRGATDTLLRAQLKIDGAMVELVTDMAQMATWLAVMNMVLHSTAWQPDREDAAKPGQAGDWTLLACSLAGFAAASGWGSWQQSVFRGSPQLALAAALPGFVGLWMTRVGFGIGRQALSPAETPSGGQEEARGRAESEVAGLALSFLTVQAACFALSGTLPGRLGPGELGAPPLGGPQAAVLALGGAACLGAAARAGALSAALGGFLGYCGSWCLYDGLCSAVCVLYPAGEDLLLHFVVALAISVCALCCAPLLGAAGCEPPAPLAQCSLGRLASSLALPPALAWARCVDLAAAAASGGIVVIPSVPTECLVGMAVAALVAAAWRKRLQEPPLGGLHAGAAEHPLLGDAPRGGGAAAAGAASAKAGVDFGGDLADALQRMHELLLLQPPDLQRLRVTASGVSEVGPSAAPGARPPPRRG